MYRVKTSLKAGRHVNGSPEDTHSCTHTHEHTLLHHSHAYRIPARTHTRAVREYHWWKQVCRSTRMDGESIWNWSAYAALIPAFGADFRLTIQTLLMHRNHICLLPILVVNNQQVRWGCVFLLLLTSIAFLLTSLQIQKKGEMPGVEDSPHLLPSTTVED